VRGRVKGPRSTAAVGVGEAAAGVGVGAASSPQAVRARHRHRARARARFISPPPVRKDAAAFCRCALPIIVKQ